MPIHDWTRVESGLFHAFRFQWVSCLLDTINRELPDSSWYALPERPISKKADADETDPATYARLANRIVVYSDSDVPIAVVEIVSPGNKNNISQFDEFVRRVRSLLRERIMLTVIDLFPPTPRDPLGIHPAICRGLGETVERPETEKPLTVVSYQPGDVLTAYVDPVAVGDVLPDAPLFLGPDQYIQVPLQQTYDAAWAHFPAALKPLLKG